MHDSLDRAGGGNDPEMEEKVVVKVRTKQQEEPLKLRIGKAAPFSRMFQAFREAATAKSWILHDTQLRFVFDGDILTPEGTAEDMDIEDDCVIEVYW